MAADGSVIIDSKMDNKQFTAGSKELLGAIKALKQDAESTGKRMQRSSAGYGAAMRSSISAAKEFRAELKRLEGEAQALKGKLDEAGKKKIATDELKRLSADLNKTTSAYEKLIDKKNKLKNKGVSRDSNQFKDLYYDLAKAESKMDALREKQRELTESGKGYTQGKDTAEYAQMQKQYDAVVGRLKEMREANSGISSSFSIVGQSAKNALASIGRMVSGASLSFLRKLASGAKNAAIQLAKLAGRTISNGLKRIGQYAGGAAKKLFGLGKSARQSGNGFQLSLKNLLKYGLGIRSMFVLFNRLRAAIKEGFQTLSASDPRVKASLDSLKAALNGLKGSLASAFAPILTAVAPALTTLINLLTRAINSVGMFMAALTGQGYYMAAKGVASVGDAASGASGNVKDLKRQLAGFDQLDILKENDNSNSGNTAGTTYESTPIDGAISSLVDRLKELFAAGEFEQIGRIIADGINGALQTAQDWIKWDNIGQSIIKALEAVTGTINGFIHGFDWANLGATIAEGLNTIVNTLILWFEGIDWAALGKGIGNAINRLFERVDWENIGKLVREKVGSLIIILKNALTTIKWGDTGAKLADALNSFFDDEKIWADAGATIDTTIKGLLTFGQDFIDGFDAVQAAKDIKAALRKIDWPGIAEQFWTTAKAAFGSISTFLKELLGDGTYNPFGDAVDQMWERGSGNASSRTYSETQNTSLAVTILNSIKWAIERIPWDELGTRLHKFMTEDVDWNGIFKSIWEIFVSVFTGLGDFIKASIWGEDAPDKGGTSSTITGLAGGAAVLSLPSLLKNGFGKLFGGGAATGTATSDGGSWLTKLAELAGIALFGKSAITNGKTLFDSLKEQGDKTWQITRDNLDSYFGENGRGFMGLLNDAGEVLFSGMGPEAVSIADKIGRTIASTLGIGLNNNNNNFAAGRGLGRNDQLTEEEQLRHLFEDLDFLTNEDKRVLGIPLTGHEKYQNVFESLFSLFDVGGSVPADKILQYAVENGKPELINALIDKNQLLYREHKEEFDQALNDANLEALGELLYEQGYGYQEIANGLHLNEEQMYRLIQATQDNTTATTGNTKVQKDNAVSGFFSSIKEKLNGGGNGGFFGGLNDLLNKDKAVVDVGVSYTPQGSGGNSFTNKPLEYLKKVFAPGTDAKTRVELIKQGWSTLSGFVGTNSPLSALIGLAKQGWSTLGGFVGVNSPLSALIGLAKSGWSTLGGFVGVNSPLSALIGLAKSGWTTLGGFVGVNSPLSALVSLVKNGWSSLAGFTGDSVSVKTSLTKNGWSTISNFVGNSVSVGTQLLRRGWSSIDDFVGDEVSVWTQLIKWGWNNIENFVGSNVDVFTALRKNGWNNILQYVTGNNNGVITITANIATGAVNGLLAGLRIQGKALGGYITAGGISRSFASGGVIKDGVARFLSNVPHYAGGTTHAHGTLFVAGEAGPEVMGHINGRTEILNKSQIAQAIYNAVVNGMGAAVNALGSYITRHMSNCTNAVIGAITSISGLAAVSNIEYYTPAIATGGIMPYDVSAQIAKSTEALQGTLDANNEDLIQTIISALGTQTAALVAALQAVERSAGATGMSYNTATQRAIDEINQRSRMYGESPLVGAL